MQEARQHGGEAPSFVSCVTHGMHVTEPAGRGVSTPRTTLHVSGAEAVPAEQRSASSAPEQQGCPFLPHAAQTLPPPLASTHCATPASHRR